MRDLDAENEQLTLFDSVADQAVIESQKGSVQSQKAPRCLCDLADERYLTDKEVANRFGVSRQTVWRWAQTPRRFPAPLRLSSGTSRWRLSDLVDFERLIASGAGGATHGAIADVAR